MHTNQSINQSIICLFHKQQPREITQLNSYIQRESKNETLYTVVHSFVKY